MSFRFPQKSDLDWDISWKSKFAKVQKNKFLLKRTEFSFCSWKQTNKQTKTFYSVRTFWSKSLKRGNHPDAESCIDNLLASLTFPPGPGSFYCHPRSTLFRPAPCTLPGEADLCRHRLWVRNMTSGGRKESKMEVLTVLVSSLGGHLELTSPSTEACCSAPGCSVYMTFFLTGLYWGLSLLIPWGPEVGSHWPWTPALCLLPIPTALKHSFFK